jgi:hypothetical protein
LATGEVPHKSGSRNLITEDFRNFLSKDIEDSVLIRLSQTHTRCSESGFCGVKLGVGGCGHVARDAEQRTEGVKGVEAAVEAEGELVELSL